MNIFFPVNFVSSYIILFLKFVTQDRFASKIMINMGRANTPSFTLLFWGLLSKIVKISLPTNATLNLTDHSTVWGPSPIQRQNTNSKRLTIEKLSKSGLRWCTKFGQAHSNDEQKITLSLILHFILDFRI